MQSQHSISLAQNLQNNDLTCMFDQSFVTLILTYSQPSLRLLVTREQVSSTKSSPLLLPGHLGLFLHSMYVLFHEK